MQLKYSVLYLLFINMQYIIYNLLINLKNLLKIHVKLILIYLIYQVNTNQLIIN